MKAIIYFLPFLSLFACQNPKEETIQTSEEIELEVDIRKLNSPVQSSLRGISVLSEEVAWLSGAKGSILMTMDGGNNWAKIPAPDRDSLDFRSVHAFSEMEAIIVSAGFPARVYKTLNAGKSWGLMYENMDSAAFMNSIAFKNEKEGIIMGDQLNGRHLILKTADGGNSWERLDSVNVPKPLKVENAFAASGSCITISESGKYVIGFGGEQTRIFKSDDGNQWNAISTPMYHGSPSSGIYSIASSGEGQIMAVGGDYTLADSSHYPIISVDNGESWIETKGQVSGYRSVIAYSQKEKVWLTGGTNGMDLSYDHGDTWSNISDANVNTLRFAPNSSKAYAGTSEGEILLIDISVQFKTD